MCVQLFMSPVAANTQTNLLVCLFIVISVITAQTNLISFYASVYTVQTHVCLTALLLLLSSKSIFMRSIYVTSSSFTPHNLLY